MKIFTIGFTKKTAEEFFNLLTRNNVKVIIDTRLNNVSQLSGYAKGIDLKYFLKKLCDIDYIHEVQMAPSDEILKAYRNKEITWNEYETRYLNLLHTRNIKELINEKYLDRLDHSCVLCSEDLPDKCHRRLLVDYIKEEFPEQNISIEHLI